MSAGAGICGLSAASWLRRAGHDVTLLDKDRPGAGASFGNAGLLAQWAIVPVNTPGVLTTGLKYALNPNKPLFLQWSYFQRLTPGLMKFRANANDRETRRMVRGIPGIVAKP
ncbi:MAG: FAD-dependent oxidoreductase, partial [Rhodobiaceae bacterium]|nr:FAD-dependent oxidoreductase [Rhodobiaceae bacterium]